MGKEVSKEKLKLYRSEFEGSKRNRLAQNAALRTSLKQITLNSERFSKINHSFSVLVPDELPIAIQKKSGRCWLFAALNLLRIDFARRHKLKKFEFSQNYLFFCDKFEKANYFYESIIESAKESVDSRLICHLLAHPVQDGGQWHMFVGLIQKYGIVPQTAFPDTEACFDSLELNYILTLKLRKDAYHLRTMIEKGAKKAQVDKEKDRMLEEVHRILCIHLGTPPTKFDWEAQNTEKKFIGEYGVTPLEFFKHHIKYPIEEYVCLVHSPRKSTPLNKTYTIEHLGSAIEGPPILYVNVTTEEMRQATIKSLKAKEPVWFGCDVGKMSHRTLGVMDLKLYDFTALYDVDFSIDKAVRMNYGESQMTHAMLFTGVNLVDEKPTRWRVENSWAKDMGEDGYFIMSDDWFDEYMFEVAINPKYLPKNILELAKQKPTPLPPWDPLGALA
jgi:bleomycin hydrolase